MNWIYPSQHKNNKVQYWNWRPDIDMHPLSFYHFHFLPCCSRWYFSPFKRKMFISIILFDCWSFLSRLSLIRQCIIDFSCSIPSCSKTKNLIFCDFNWEDDSTTYKLKIKHFYCIYFKKCQTLCTVYYYCYIWAIDHTTTFNSRIPFYHYICPPWSSNTFSV